jgi:hypothetical protein
VLAKCRQRSTYHQAIKRYLIGTVAALIGGIGSAQVFALPSTDTRAVPTYESVGLYWSNPGAVAASGCEVKYRRTGDTAWKQGLAMWFDARNNECRGSLVQLSANTDYEVEFNLSLQPASRALAFKTWPNQRPVAQTVSVASGAATLKVVADADFNGDGVADLLWRNTTTGSVYAMPFVSSGMPTGGAVIMTESNPAWKIVHTPDLDGDGKADILWWNSTTGQVYAVIMNGTAITAQGFVYTEPNTAWKIVAQGDYNGDGKEDLLWRNETTGQVYMMLMNGLGIASQTMVYQEANTAWKLLGPWEYAQ